MTTMLMIGLALVVFHGMAVGAYLTMYKLKVNSTAGAMVSVLSIGTIYSLLTGVLATAIMFIHP